MMFEDKSDWDALRALYEDMVNRGQATYGGVVPVRYFIGQTGREWLWADRKYM